MLAEALGRFDADVRACCLMGNRCHLVLQAHAGRLSRPTRRRNGVCTQASPRHHGLVGHLLLGRFKAALVDRDNDPVAVCRYATWSAVRSLRGWH